MDSLRALHLQAWQTLLAALCVALPEPGADPALRPYLTASPVLPEDPELFSAYVNGVAVVIERRLMAWRERTEPEAVTKAALFTQWEELARWFHGAYCTDCGPFLWNLARNFHFLLRAGERRET